MDLKKVVIESDAKSGKQFDYFIQCLIVLSLISFCIGTLHDLSVALRRALRIIEIGTVTIFTVEYLLRIYFSEKKLKFVFSFYGLIDLIAILPFYLSTGVDTRSIRVFRLFRLFRALKLMRYTQAINRFQRSFSIIREELIIFLVACAFLLFVASTGIYFFESDAQPEAFQSVFHCMWWAVATLTTVGYGDVYPITVGGRIFTTLILMIGLGIIAVPAGLISSALSQTLKEEKEGMN